MVVLIRAHPLIQFSSGGMFATVNVVNATTSTINHDTTSYKEVQGKLNSMWSDKMREIENLSDVSVLPWKPACMVSSTFVIRSAGYNFTESHANASENSSIKNGHEFQTCIQ